MDVVKRTFWFLIGLLSFGMLVVIHPPPDWIVWSLLLVVSMINYQRFKENGRE